MREDLGKGASRRLRRLAGEIPAIVYGGKKDPAKLTLLHKDVVKALENEAFLTLNLDGKKESVLLRDYQMHPVRNNIQHIDFQRIVEDEKIRMQIPIHFLGEEDAIGVKIGGGSVSRLMTELEVSCLPKDLPEFLEVDISELELDQMLHVSNISLPTGVETSRFSLSYDNVGYIFKENLEVYFGNRDIKSTENNMSLNYNFDSYKSINIKLRQFWSTAKYLDSFYLLKSNGERKKSSKNNTDFNPNTNFNLWNFDLGFNWEFAPGSKATLLYRNNIFNEDNMQI